MKKVQMELYQIGELNSSIQKELFETYLRNGLANIPSPLENTKNQSKKIAQDAFTDERIKVVSDLNIFYGAGVELCYCFPVEGTFIYKGTKFSLNTNTYEGCVVSVGLPRDDEKYLEIKRRVAMALLIATQNIYALTEKASSMEYLEEQLCKNNCLFTKDGVLIKSRKRKDE